MFKEWMKFLTNQKGLSLVQLGVALGISGLLSVVMLKQTTNTQKSNKKFEQVNDINMFTSDIAIKLSSKQSCEATLKGKVFSANTPTSIDEIKMRLPTGIENIILKTGNKYIGDKLQIDDIKVVAIDEENFELLITYTNLSIKEGYNKIIKSIQVPVVTTLAGTNYTVTDCFYSNTEAVSGVANNVANICEGDGLVIDAGDNCEIKNFVSPYASTLNCPQGQALVDIQYNPMNLTYSGVCKKVFQMVPGCTGNRVQSASDDGSLVCLNVLNLVDSSARPRIYENSSCELSLSGNRLRLDCSCAPSCAPASNICAGTIDYTSNKCGSPCGTSGTKTTGSCDSCTPSSGSCDAPAGNVCVGETAYGNDNCGSPCSKPGTKTTGSCSSCTGCSADSSSVCTGGTAYGVDSCGNSCSIPGSKTPTCPSANDVCQGTTNTDPDGCGGTCNVVGTKTTGSCAAGTSCSDYVSGGGSGSRCCASPTVTCCPSSNPSCILGGPGSATGLSTSDGLYYFNHSMCPPGYPVLDGESGSTCLMAAP